MKPTIADYRVTAEAEYEDVAETHRFDSAAEVTLTTEHGAWVACWVWVADSVVETDS